MLPCLTDSMVQGISDLLIFTLPGKITSNVKMATPLSPPSVKKKEKRKLGRNVAADLLR
jgi:hypothetical protein